MKDFFLEALLYPFLAILFCLVFGVPFTFAGFQTIHLQGFKENGSVSMHFEREHFWGLYTMEEYIEGVQRADLANDRFRQGGWWRMATSVFLVTKSESHRVMAGSSDVDEKLKWGIVKSINEYIDNPNVFSYNKTFRIHNVFGWFGLPFLVLGVLGLVGWPGSIIKKMKH